MVSVDISEGRANLDALSEWLRSEAPRDRDTPERGVGFLAEISSLESGWGGWKNPECQVWAGALNHADLSSLLKQVGAMSWRCPNALQVFVMDQEESFFRVWMLRDGRLRQYAPEQPSEEDPDFYPVDI